MPGTTPVYGFPYPEPTDLVADYPALGQDLAEDIETVLPTLGGLKLITAQTFSAVASVAVNNCFSSTYANYRVLLEYVPSGTFDANIRMRVGGVDSSASTYARTEVGAYTSGTGITLGNSGQTSWNILQGTTAIYSVASFDFHNPFVVTRTNVIFGCYLSNSTAQYAVSGAGIHDTSLSYDGFSVIASSGTISGTIRVYGYRNS
jgi:hypothetical protein